MVTAYHIASTVSKKQPLRMVAFHILQSSMPQRLLSAYFYTAVYTLC